MLEKAGLTFCAACGLALIHVFAGRLPFVGASPRSAWLSLAGGVSVAYAIVHLLPDLEDRRRTIAGGSGNSSALDHLLYLIVLAGLLFFYGLEKLAQRGREARSDDEPSDDKAPDAIFWLHVASFAAFNALIGYALVKEDRDLRALVLYVIAIGLHFLVNDDGLRQKHQRQYSRFVRWALSAAVLAGWAIGIVAAIPPVVTAGILGFLAGGILLNTFKEELPPERESRFWVFCAGATVYSAVLLVR